MICLFIILWLYINKILFFQFRLYRMFYYFILCGDHWWDPFSLWLIAGTQKSYLFKNSIWNSLISRPFVEVSLYPLYPFLPTTFSFNQMLLFQSKDLWAYSRHNMKLCRNRNKEQLARITRTCMGHVLVRGQVWEEEQWKKAITLKIRKTNIQSEIQHITIECFD